MLEIFARVHYNISRISGAKSNIGVSPSGKATDSDSVIRWFKSSHPSHRRGKASFERKQFLIAFFSFYAYRSSFAQILQFCARAMVLIIFELFCPFFVQKRAFLLLFYVCRPLNENGFLLLKYGHYPHTF